MSHHNHATENHDHNHEDIDQESVTPEKVKEYLEAHPALNALSEVFGHLNITREEHDAGVDPVVVDGYLRDYAFHPVRLEERRDVVRDLLVANVNSEAFFNGGGHGISLTQEPGREDLFSSPESADAFVALSVALGFAKLEIPNNLPPEMALLLGLDTLIFNLTPGVQAAAA